MINFEKTLVLIKPDIYIKNIQNLFIKFIHDQEFKIIGSKLTCKKNNLIFNFHPKKSSKFFDNSNQKRKKFTEDFNQTSNELILLFIIEGDNVISEIKKFLMFLKTTTKIIDLEDFIYVSENKNI